MRCISLIHMLIHLTKVCWQLDQVRQGFCLPVWTPRVSPAVSSDSQNTAHAGQRHFKVNCSLSLGVPRAQLWTKGIYVIWELIPGTTSRRVGRQDRECLCYNVAAPLGLLAGRCAAGAGSRARPGCLWSQRGPLVRQSPSCVPCDFTWVSQTL